MILGLTGTIGAGKGTVVDYLKTKGFAHYAARDFITAEIEQRGLPLDRDSMTLVANDLRHEHGAAYIIKSLMRQAQTAGGDAIIESVRAVAETEALKARGALLLAVDADERRRYERIVARGSATDHVDFATFVAQEAREMANRDPEKQNIAAVMRLADATIENDGTLDELHAAVDAFLAQVTR